MATSSRQEAPYEREERFFQFPPVAFVDDVINAVNDYMSDGLDALEASLVSDKAFKGREKQVTEAVNRIFERFQRSVDRNFDKFELYVLRNIFRIPPNVDISAREPAMVAPVGSVEDSMITPQDEGRLDRELYELRRQVHAVMLENALLQQENSEIDLACAAASDIRAAVQEEDAADVEQVRQLPAQCEAAIEQANRLYDVSQNTKMLVEQDVENMGSLLTASALQGESVRAETLLGRAGPAELARAEQALRPYAY